MARSYRNVELMQQVEYLPGKSIDFIKKVLEDDERIVNYAYILHDKDIKEDGTPKPAHYHIMIKFKGPLQLSTICKMFKNKVPEQYFNNIKGSWGDALAYLTHLNAPNKYQYTAENVVSNFQWKKEVKKRKTEKNKTNEDIQSILTDIVEGKIRRFNYTKYIDGLTYVKYKRQIEDAFNYRADAIKGEANRKMECIYIHGFSGSGKTTYAKYLAEKGGYSYFISSGSNDVLDGYAGQDCLILDDLRPSCMGLSDLLKLLDNNTASTVKSRYKNKFLECKIVIITTTLGIDDFFKNVFSEQPETCVQLKRRCQMLVKFGRSTSADLELYTYNPYTYRYDLEGTMENPVKSIVKPKKAGPAVYCSLFNLSPDCLVPVQPVEDDEPLPF